MYELINDLIMPKWTEMLSKISKRERELGVIQKGTGYALKQLLSDVQRYFRLIFKHRFHRLDKRNNEKSEALAERMLFELGINHKEDLKRAFNYFYPILNKLRKDER